MVYNQAPQQFVNPGSVVNPNVANVNLTPAKTGRVYLEDDYGLLPVIRFSNDGNNNNSNANATAAQKEEGNFIYLIKGFHLNTLGFRNKLQGRDNLCSTTATLFLDDEGDILHHDMEQQQQNNEKYNFNLGTKKYYVLPDYKMSETYKKPKPKELSMKTFSLFKEETLFYVFYSMPRDVLHLAAAKTLYERRWKYHKRFQFWFQLPDGNEAQYMHADYEGKGPAYMAPFRLFNPNTWKVITTEANYVILLSDLEEESVLKEAMERAAIKSRERQQQQQQQQKQ
ncbi:hypothetical protein AGDE_15898 [Angomonas deanei]|uniref:NOT2 / NOT3 / NOT5 family, putative n=1 Tax=Angomonas deanei TaxID=59799 RepID=A0A7G2CMI7_9TRYP|nr:hypothetical protein AGDE_15898 [Angomonas deanei]CAD2220635.1 NOT2 / NOT3 / NOT5 family, putative [Angomonas deanei]|eukprot:EPY18190.1 hypothetical protein AGDE_15898 [Angomonas deanei]